VKQIVSLFEELDISSMANLKKVYENCTKCDLQFTRTCVVMYEGPDKADLMVIGQSPGATEDNCGVPFMGKAGGRLNAVLSMVRLPRPRIHVSNAVWCRNHDGRYNLPPKPEHLLACNSRLQKEISLVDPNFIVCLGKEAMQSTLGLGINTAIGTMRAKGWREIHVAGRLRNVLVSWHPAYELRHSEEEKRKPAHERNFVVNKQMADDWRSIAAKVPHLLER